jgi:NAD+ synthase
MTVCEQGEDSEALNEREKIVLGIYKRLNAINQHKMVAIPVCKID